MKLFSWNVNGIRSVFRTTFREWLAKNDPDIVCIQETKADWRELDEEITQIDGYYSYFNSSHLRKGHSGVAVYTKMKPQKIETTLGISRFDDEGRVLKLTFKDFTLFNLYIPNGSRDQHEMPYKLSVYKDLLRLFAPLAKKNTVLCGDFNIARDQRDVFNAKENENNTMFTPAEREQLAALIDLGFVDTFREKYPDKREYSWWHYGRGLRERNVGWRIDYFFVSQPLAAAVLDASTHREVLGSDHGPIGLELDKPLPKAKAPVYKKKPKQTELF